MLWPSIVQTSFDVGMAIFQRRCSESPSLWPERRLLRLIEPSESMFSFMSYPQRRTKWGQRIRCSRIRFVNGLDLVSFAVCQTQKPPNLENLKNTTVRRMLKSTDTIPSACRLEPLLFSPRHLLQPRQLGLHGERRVGHGKPRLRDEISASKRHLRRPQPLFPIRPWRWRTWLLSVPGKLRHG